MQFDDYLRTAAVDARAYDSVAQLWQAYIAEHGGPPVMPRRYTTRRPYVCGDTLYKNFVNVRMQRGDPGSTAEERKALIEATKKAITAASKIANPVHVLVAGIDCANAANDAASTEGVEKVLHAENSQYKNMLSEPISELLIDLMSEYDYLVAAATTNGKNILPRVAAKLDVSQISEIISVINGKTFQRPIYAGNAIATVESSTDKNVITIRTTAFETAKESKSTAEISSIGIEKNPGLSEFIEEKVSGGERPELTSAGTIVSGGRGMQSGDNFKLLESVADKLGAAVGASRAAVDAGFVPNEYQVGQTGKVVAPELYIAVGISGAIQHLAGMKDSKVIVAINKDDEAPIFEVADYGLVADLFDAVPDLDKELEKIQK